jgi:hypothetical protein
MKFCQDGSGSVRASDLRVAFKCQGHPKVCSGEITDDEAFLEFLTNFGDKNNNGMITMIEWGDYYSAIAFCIENDDHFFQLMDATWC